MPVSVTVDGTLDNTDLDVVHIARDHATGKYVVTVDYRAGREHRQARAVAEGPAEELCTEAFAAAIAVAQAGLAALSSE